jgi:hypothetical protein
MVNDKGWRKNTPDYYNGTLWVNSAFTDQLRDG